MAELFKTIRNFVGTLLLLGVAFIALVFLAGVKEERYGCEGEFTTDWIPKDELLSKRALFDWALSLCATAAMLWSSWWFAETFMRFSK